MTAINVLVMIHGMTVKAGPADHKAEYNLLWKGLTSKQPDLGKRIDECIKVEWGHEPAQPPTGPRPDHLLTRAELHLLESVGWERVKGDSDPDISLLPSSAELFSQLLLRRLTLPIKETVILLGLTDAMYYCSPDGERAVRQTVYSQVLNGLEKYREEDDVRLHIVGHSLGVTVAHDFLYGLFAPESDFPQEHQEQPQPGFVQEKQGDPVAVQAYTHWRERAQRGGLKLGSKISTGGQLPLMMMRKQKLVDTLAKGRSLDSTVIGVPNAGAVRWKSFFDVDDVLGFPIRNLFATRGTIKEYQVDTGWRPDLAHSTYWENDTVLSEAASLIVQNLD